MKSMQELVDYLNDICNENREVTAEDVKKVVEDLNKLIKVQNEIFHEIKNSNIRIENRIKYVENEVEKSRIYKNIVDTMIQKIRVNPIIALIYFYRIKRNIEKMGQE